MGRNSPIGRGEFPAIGTWQELAYSAAGASPPALRLAVTFGWSALSLALAFAFVLDSLGGAGTISMWWGFRLAVNYVAGCH